MMILDLHHQTTAIPGNDLDPVRPPGRNTMIVPANGSWPNSSLARAARLLAPFLKSTGRVATRTRVPEPIPINGLPSGP